MTLRFIYFFAVAAILFIGFGCSSSIQTPTTNSATTDNSVTVESVGETNVSSSEVEEKAWRLSFDLPIGWVMAVYGSPRSKNLTAPDLVIEKDAKNIYLQNTTKFPLFGGIKPDDYSAEKYQSENVVQIKVSLLPSDEVVPPADSFKNEDLNNGFFKATNCDVETVPECEIYGQSSADYYFIATSGNKYRFSFANQGVEKSVIETVILSAKE